MKQDPVPYIHAEFLPSNILEWHYVIIGPKDSPYSGGYYHGSLIFTKDFPFKPPSIYMYTPNGRFKPGISANFFDLFFLTLTYWCFRQASLSFDLWLSSRYMESGMECQHYTDRLVEHHARKFTTVRKLWIDELWKTETCNEFYGIQFKEWNFQVSFNQLLSIQTIKVLSFI